MLTQILRRLIHSPMFTVTSLLTLAIGIGANTAIFSVVDGILLKPLPYPEPDRLIGVWHTAKGLNINEINICPSLYFTYREQNRTLQDIGAYNEGSVSVTQIAKPEQIQSLFVTEGVLPILGAHPVLGRLFSRQDDTDGSPLTAILSYGYWKSHFGGSSSAIGRRIMLDGRAREVIGVLPASFRFLSAETAVVLPLQFNRGKVFLGNFSYLGIARLKAGVSLAQVNADIARMIPIWLKTFPPPPGFSAKLFEDARLGPAARPFMQDVVGDIGNVLWVLMGTIGVVLLIASANVANLLLVRAEGRQQELAIRSALGASWGQVARDLLSESMVLAVGGGLLGVAAAYGALRLLVRIAPAGLPRLDEISVDPRALLFTSLVAGFAGVFFSVLPVFKYAGARPGTGLRGSTRSVSASRERNQARNMLVVIQVALALVLLIGSVLMMRTFQALRSVQPGFLRPAEVLTLRVSIPDGEVKEPERAIRMFQEMLAKVSAIPGVHSAALVSSNTMDSNNSGDVLFVEDHSVAEGKIPPVRRYKFISPGFFHAVGRPLIAGRDLTWDDIYSFHPVIILSENLAREYWHEPAAALGKRVREGPKDDWREVIGVVGDEYDDGVQTKPPSVTYWPLLTKKLWGEDVFARRTLAFSIRSTRTGSAAFLTDVQKAIWSVGPNSPVADVYTLAEIYDKSMARTSFTLVMLAVASSMALLLGLVGIYGVISYSVSLRRREIGIRLALGSSQQAVSGMFVRHGFILATVGVLCGLLASVGLTRLLSSLLYGVAPNDPLTFIVVSVGLIAAAILSSYLPARRAMAVDPIETLRAE